MLSLGTDSSVTFQKAAFCCAAAGWGQRAGSFVTPRHTTEAGQKVLVDVFSIVRLCLELWMIFCPRLGEKAGPALSAAWEAGGGSCL